MPAIRHASTPEDLDAVRRLMRAFVAWHHDRHHKDRARIDRYFDAATFEAELSGLPGEYAPPRGCLLLAADGAQEAGCVALHDLGDGACEMKRLFVYPAFHGHGLGKTLAEAVIEEARRIGYHTMRLDTGPEQREAQGLYRRLGFRDVAPYYVLEPEMRDWLVFMERRLEA